MFSDLDVEEINKIKNENINKLKIKLANEATSMLHGNEKALLAEKTAKQTFEENSLGENLPSIKIKLTNNDNNISIVDLIVLSKLENSKSEIRRIIKNKGVKINNATIDDEKLLITNNLFDNNKSFKLSLGKKRHIKVELS